MAKDKMPMKQKEMMMKDGDKMACKKGKKK
jgi:hypothetical protein